MELREWRFASCNFVSNNKKFIKSHFFVKVTYQWWCKLFHKRTWSSRMSISSSIQHYQIDPVKMHCTAFFRSHSKHLGTILPRPRRPIKFNCVMKMSFVINKIPAKLQDTSIPPQSHQKIFYAAFDCHIKNQFGEWLACNFSLSNDNSRALVTSFPLSALTSPRNSSSGMPVMGNLRSQLLLTKSAGAGDV